MLPPPELAHREEHVIICCLNFVSDKWIEGLFFFSRKKDFGDFLKKFAPVAQCDFPGLPIWRPGFDSSLWQIFFYQQITRKFS